MGSVKISVWVTIAVFVFLGWTSVFNPNQTEKVDIALQTSDIYGVSMVDGESLTLESGVQLQFRSMGNLKMAGSSWRVLVEVNGETVSLDQGQYVFQDGPYELDFCDGKLDLFRLYPG